MNLYPIYIKTYKTIKKGNCAIKDMGKKLEQALHKK